MDDSATPAGEPTPQPQARGLESVRTLAIVDSRNMLHQAEKLLGYSRLPTVDGVVTSLSRYGFDVTAVHVGLAIPRSSDSARLEKFARENRAYQASVEKHPLGRALLGELHVKDGNVVQEKQVDVACAVDIARYATEMARGEARFQAIVVVSQDSDLAPAYRYALDEMQIPLVVAACDVVNHRAEPFVLLGEPAMRDLCELTEPLQGQRLRAAVAACAKARRKDAWEVVGWDSQRKAHLLRTRDGVLGVAELGHVPRGRTAPGNTHELYAEAVEFGPPMFPVVRCSPHKPSGPSDLRTGIVSRRYAAYSIEVSMANGAAERMFCAPGYVRPGAEVLVQEGRPCRFVGALSEPPAAATRLGPLVEPGDPVLVRVISALSGTMSVGVLPGSGRVAIAHSKAEAPDVGGIYAVVLSDEVPARRKWPLAHLVSSRLPRP